MIKDILKNASERMDKTLEAFRQELHKVRTGKATTALLDGVKVDYYGTPTLLNKLANISVQDAHSLLIQPYDRTAIQLIDKAILKSDLGFNPVSDGQVLRVPIPPLNEERRRDFVKLVKKFGEEAKVALRNVRRDANEHLKKAQKDEHASEDEVKKAEKHVQEITDKHIVTIDQLVKTKEGEIMEV
jgi:ribosome recycling factor